MIMVNSQNLTPEQILKNINARLPTIEELQASGPYQFLLDLDSRDDVVGSWLDYNIYKSSGRNYTTIINVLLYSHDGQCVKDYPALGLNAEELRIFIQYSKDKNQTKQ